MHKNSSSPLSLFSHNWPSEAFNKNAKKSHSSLIRCMFDAFDACLLRTFIGIWGNGRTCNSAFAYKVMFHSLASAFFTPSAKLSFPSSITNQFFFFAVEIEQVYFQFSIQTASNGQCQIISPTSFIMSEQLLYAKHFHDLWHIFIQYLN